MPSSVPGLDMAGMINPYAAIGGAALGAVGTALTPAPGDATSHYSGGNTSINVGGLFSPGSGVSHSADSDDPGLLGAVTGGDDLGSRIVQGILITLVSGLVYTMLKRGRG